jgi:hypothetical protein
MFYKIYYFGQKFFTPPQSSNGRATTACLDIIVRNIGKEIAFILITTYRSHHYLKEIRRFRFN